MLIRSELLDLAVNVIRGFFYVIALIIIWGYVGYLIARFIYGLRDTLLLLSVQL